MWEKKVAQTPNAVLLEKQNKGCFKERPLKKKNSECTAIPHPVPHCRAGHFRYFLIFSIVKKGLLIFLASLFNWEWTFK